MRRVGRVRSEVFEGGELGCKNSEVKEIVKDVLGTERNGIRVEGLVDAADDKTFRTNFDKLKKNWPKKFIEWLEHRGGRQRCLLDTMSLCMLKPVRVAAGLGNPPNKWVNNVTEALHNVIKEELNHDALDVVAFLEKVKERVFDQQLTELIRGIQGMGEYRLAPTMQSYAVTPTQWTEMTTEQRKAHVKKVLSLASDDFQEPLQDLINTCKLSVQLAECQESLNIPLATLKRIWHKAEFLLANCHVSRLLGGNYCVTDYSQAYNVEETASKIPYHCCCKDFKDTDGLCGHVVAVCEFKGCLKAFLEQFGKHGADLNKIINRNIPMRGGDKQHQKKPRKGQNNVKMAPIVQVYKLHPDSQSEAPLAVAVDEEIDKQKDMVFTEYWHNNELFYVHLTSDVECQRAKRCETCRLEFPKQNPMEGVSDLIIVHKERYMRPVKDEANNFIRSTLTNKLGRKFYCPKKKCLIKRHPYFWKGLIRVDEPVRQRLKSVHYKTLFQQIHFSTATD